MLAPSQMKFDTVRDPSTKLQSSVKGSSFVTSFGLKVPSGSQMQIRSLPCYRGHDEHILKRRDSPPLS